MNNQVVEIVTNTIIKSLEQGTAPWMKPWSGGEERPMNAVSKKPYRGINVWILVAEGMFKGYTDNRWLTFKQCQQLGGTVKKGEHGTAIVFWKFIKVDDKNNPDEKTSVPLLRYYTVFNVQQTTLELGDKVEGREFSPCDCAEKVVAGYKDAPSIEFGGGRAYYAPKLDKVVCPKPETFLSDDYYYQTLYHELVHSTGHEKRLNRNAVQNVSFGSQDYSEEELVAELGASMLMLECGQEPHLENAAAYCASWLQVLSNNRNWIITASGKAQKAVDYIKGECESELVSMESE